MVDPSRCSVAPRDLEARGDGSPHSVRITETPRAAALGSVTRTAALVRGSITAKFRQQDALTAYAGSCTVCRLRHIHHAAFDSNILGVRPDHVIEIRADVLEEVDGPMLTTRAFKS